ncbi:hypothetical protein BX616_007824 [Lobosporangium transversale]|nr:hypothetical protein BX616_007824 [Lobosporangium transversale]
MAPLLEQLKNFIRHGKSGKDMKPRDSGASVHSSSHQPSTKPRSRAGSRNSSPSRNIATSAEHRSTATSNHQQDHDAITAAGTNAGNFNNTNTEAASRIVAEEKQQKSKMPVYPGLERYKLIEKMGE